MSDSETRGPLHLARDCVILVLAPSPWGEPPILHARADAGHV